MKLVIAGPPNAGKSSLLNALSGRDSAIVTPFEGTTRDVLREHIQIDGMPLHLVDTAGLRDSPDDIEREGMRPRPLGDGGRGPQPPGGRRRRAGEPGPRRPPEHRRSP